MLVCPLCRLVLGDEETICPRDGKAATEGRTMEPPEGALERFSIVEPFAQGVSGDLYLADDKQSSRRGLLKIIRVPEKATASERARLKREIVKQAALEHAVLSTPLATGDSDGQLWIFREWHEGVSLKVKITRGGALPLPEALTIASQIGSALDELHRGGLLHRDLSAGHIILMPQPSGFSRVAVIDAGIAGRIESDSAFTITGTPEYLSPEQAKGKLVSFRSDLYALGCILHEMLIGTPPFAGTTAELLDAHANVPAPTLQISIPGGVLTLLSKLLAKEPRERPFSAQQVRRALAPFLPQDEGAARESTQTFDQLTESRQAPVPGSGTLRPRAVRTSKTVMGMAVQPPDPNKLVHSVPPPPKRAASVPPPPPPEALSRPPPGPPTQEREDQTQELSPLDLEQAEDVVAGERKPRAPKTIMGMPAQRPASIPPPTPRKARKASTIVGMPAPTESVQPPSSSSSGLTASPFAPPSPTDEEPDEKPENEEKKTEKTVAAPKSMPGVLGRLDGGVEGGIDGGKSEPRSASIPPPASIPPASPSKPPPASLPALSLASAEAVLGPASTPTPFGAPIDDSGDDSLDYDDLAETVAFDKSSNTGLLGKLEVDRAPISGSPPATRPSSAPPAAVISSGEPSPFDAAYDQAAVAVAAPAKKRSGLLLGVAAVVVAAGACLLLTIVAGVGVLLVQPSEEVMVADVEGATPLATSAPELAPEVPTHADPPISANVPPAFPPQPPRATVDEPLEDEPTEDEPTEDEPLEHEPAPRAAAVERPSRPATRPVARRPRRRPPRRRPAASAPSGMNRLQRFQRARSEALAHFRARRFGPAASSYERATQLNPRHAGSWAGLGAARLAQGHTQQAIHAYRRATQLQPNHAGFHAALGQAYQRANDRARARQSFQRALQIDPNHRGARAGLGR